MTDESLIAAFWKRPDWNAMLHPRDRNGRFVETGGWVDIWGEDPYHHQPIVTGRGQVTGIKTFRERGISGEKEDVPLYEVEIEQPDGTTK